MVDVELVVSLRVVVGLLIDEEIFSIFSFLDDEENGFVFGCLVKFFIKGLVDKFLKKSKEYRKYVSKKVYYVKLEF